MEERRKITIEFAFERETKNTFRYQEVVEPGYPSKVGTIYIQKWIVGSKAPARLKVTIEPQSK
ncbi:MAG: hypothetical protein ACE5II_00340 [Anaerolineae bacterium]